MKQFFLFLLIFASIIVIFNGCSSSIDNNINFKNKADGDIFVNFRGEEITIPAGQTVTVKEIPKGTYSYSTTFEIPAGATSSSSTGDVTGSIDIKAGTKVLVIYSSTLISGQYTLYATLSNSDDENADQNPLLP